MKIEESITLNPHGFMLAEEKKNKIKCPLCPKEYQSPNDLERHLSKIHNEKLCESCQMEIATTRCEKGSILCYTCAGFHIGDGHRVYDLER